MLFLDRQKLKKNLEALGRSALAHRLKDLPLPSPEAVQVRESQKGEATFRYRNRWIHSRIDPRGEGQRFAERLQLKGGDQVILYGFGLGYHVEAILKTIGSRGRLLVLELNSDLLLSALALRDFSPLFGMKNFTLIGGPGEEICSREFSQALDSQWPPLEDSRKKVLFYPPSYQAWPEGFEKLKNAFELLKMERRFGSVLGERSRINRDKNREAVHQSQGVKSLFGQFKGELGILVGSGPSLDSALPCLKYLPPRRVLLAVDSALPALLENGISADFIISTDPQENTINHLEGYLDRGIPLIFIPQTNPLVVAHYEGSKYVAIQKGSGDFDQAPKKGCTDSGGAASCIALDLLIKFGVEKVILVGIDSAFPGDRFYANDALESRKLFHYVDRFRSLHDLHRGKIGRSEKMKASNGTGQRVTTHRNLFSYLRTMGEIIEKADGHISFYQLGAQGAAIEGVTPITSPFGGKIHQGDGSL